MPAESELFDPKFLGRLRTLFFKLRKRRQLKKRGAEQTPASGFTREFKDHRQYTPGDDYRAVDWLLFARLERLFIRIFEEVQEYHIHVLLDRSRSMVEPCPEKRVSALRLAVALAYLGLVSQHRVSLLTLGPELRREMPPIKGPGHIHALLRHLAALEFAGTTDLAGCFRQFRPGRDRKGIIFVVSDLLGEAPELAEQAVAHATSWGSESHVIHVLDPREMRPDLEGEVRLVDVESDEARRVWLTKGDMRRYAEAFEAYRAGVERACTRRQIDYMTWTTDQSFEDLFLRLLSRGSALAGA